MRPERVEKKVGKRAKCISPSRSDDPPEGCKFETLAPSSDSELSTFTNSQLHPPINFGFADGRIGALPLTFQTTPTTSSTHVIPLKSLQAAL